MKYVMRVRGWNYDGGEHIVPCWLGKSGAIYGIKSAARIYDSEAEAWEHAISAGHATGWSNEDEHGLICWTEEVP